MIPNCPHTTILIPKVLGIKEALKDIQASKMFQFSKVMATHKQKQPEQYFGSWILWFESRGIKTEIRPSRKGPSLWREGIEAKEKKQRRNKK